MTTRAGFTMVEILLYLAVAVSVAVGAFQAIQFLESAQVRATARTGVDAEAAFLADTFREVLRGTTVSAPVPQEEQDTLLTADGTGITTDDWRVTIDRGGGVAYLTSPRVTVSGLRFRNLAVPDSPDLIRVEFTLTASPAGDVAPGSSYSHDYRTTIGTR